jgi:hypothetical protein
VLILIVHCIILAALYMRTIVTVASSQMSELIANIPPKISQDLPF